MALEPTDPPTGLVQWASRYPTTSRVHLPWDRPWYSCPDEMRKTPDGYWISCGLCLVLMNRIITPDPDKVLYIGQCSCHERIIFSYRPK